MMKRTAILAATLLVASAIPATAVTFQGNVGNGGMKTIGIVSNFSGQVVITLAWTKKNSDLDLLMECDGVPWGVSAATEERFERLEVGLFGGQNCTLGIASFSGGSKFWANIQFTGGNTGPLAPGERAMRTLRVSPSDAPGLIEAAARVSALKH